MLVDEVGRRRCWVVAAALIVLACALVVAPVAGAEVFEVNDIGDDVDDTPDVICLTAGGKCTLRAAIEESNGSEGEFDEIIFDETVFEGQVADTIGLGSGLPAVVDRVRINGRECATAAGVSGPCVGVDGPTGGSAFTVDDVDNVEIKGVAVTGAQIGISVESAELFKPRGNWLGVELDGDPDGNTTGIFIGPESNEARIGGEGFGAGNLFADNVAEGLDILGTGDSRILGNYFGVRPDGVTKAANGKDVEITSTSAGGFEATGNAIGVKVNSEALATPACDGGCNLISGAESSGIDLEGDGGQEVPAATTTIAGNYIGLNATGTAAIPNASSGIRVGRAVQTVIGGPKAGEANRINGGSVGVDAGPAAADLVVRGNLIGVDATGTGTLAPPGDGVVVNSEELSSPAVEAVIADNEIRMGGGDAIALQGFGARIAGNEISDAEIGIKAFGSTEEHGNLLEGNFVVGAAGSGILVENGFNEILGNEIVGAVGVGIRILGSLPFFVTENLVGGDAEKEENVIVGSGAAAIEISNVEATQNEVARNRGSANGGLFIDLVAASPGTEPDGPNGGIKPPGFLTATPTGAGGSGAKAGATVRVFRKQSAEAGEIESFLGEAIADAGGNWGVAYGGAVPAGTIVAATQTGEAGGTSELATATTASEFGGGSGNGEADGAGGSGSGSDSGTSASADTISPETVIFNAPRKAKSGAVRFRFDADEFDSTFQCKLDRKPFRACSSPKKYAGLKPGRHVFKVRAIDPAGNADSSPAKRRFTVLP